MKTLKITWFVSGFLCIVTLLSVSAQAGDFFAGGGAFPHHGVARGGFVIQPGGHAGGHLGRTGHPGYYPGYYGGYYLPPPYGQDRASSSPYDFDIKPAGRLQVSVQPRDAQVFVDGLRLQPIESALFDIGLLVGAHTVRVLKPDYQPYVSDVAIETAKTTTLSVELTEERD